MAISSSEPLTAAHDVSAFSCGKPAFDRWLQTRALSNQEKGFTVVMVVHEGGRVIGYYGLAPTLIILARLPRTIRTGQPPDSVPCLLLGQLATDQDWAGKGIGAGLLKHALPRCAVSLEISSCPLAAFREIAYPPRSPCKEEGHSVGQGVWIAAIKSP